MLIDAQAKKKKYDANQQRLHKTKGRKLRDRFFYNLKDLLEISNGFIGRAQVQDVFSQVVWSRRITALSLVLHGRGEVGAVGAIGL